MHVSGGAGGGGAIGGGGGYGRSHVTTTLSSPPGGGVPRACRSNAEGASLPATAPSSKTAELASLRRSMAPTGREKSGTSRPGGKVRRTRRELTH